MKGTITVKSNLVYPRAVEPEPKQFWMAGAGAKKFWMVEPEPEISVTVQQT